VRAAPPTAEWQREVQLNHAFGDARSQSLECDGEAHTFVWVSITPTEYPAVVGSHLLRCIFTVTSPIDSSFVLITARTYNANATAMYVLTSSQALL